MMVDDGVREETIKMLEAGCNINGMYEILVYDLRVTAQ